MYSLLFWVSKNRREKEVGKLGWHGNFDTGMSRFLKDFF